MKIFSRLLQIKIMA